MQNEEKTKPIQMRKRIQNPIVLELREPENFQQNKLNNKNCVTSPQFKNVRSSN